MKFRPTRAANAHKAAKVPVPTSAPVLTRYKGAIAWLVATGCAATAAFAASAWASVQLGFTLAILAIVGSALLKLAAPQLQVRAAEKRIAAIKAKQATSRVPSARPGDTLITDPVANPVDVGQLRASDGFAFMHMGPPEVIDLDLTRQHGNRSRGALDVNALEVQKGQALEKAIELEDGGAIERAIVQYEKAIVLARQLGKDDEAISFENRVAQLKQENGM